MRHLVRSAARNTTEIRAAAAAAAAAAHLLTALSNCLGILEAMATPPEALAAAEVTAAEVMAAATEEVMDTEKQENNDLPDAVVAAPSGAAPVGILPIQEEAEPLPVPPYTPVDKAEDGLRCFYPGCTFVTNSWGSLLGHVRNKHGRKLSELNGTYLHMMGMQERNSQQAAYRRAKKQAASAKAPCVNTHMDSSTGLCVGDGETSIAEPGDKLLNMWSYKAEIISIVVRTKALQTIF